MIWMYNYNGVVVNENYVQPCQSSAVPAVTVYGGTAWGTVYDSLPPVSSKKLRQSACKA